MQKMGSQNQSVRLFEAQLESSLIVFMIKTGTADFILYVGPSKEPMSQKMRLKQTFLILKTHDSKGVQKNMLKIWSFTKNKICHGCFYSNSQNLF